jgi:tetratricopeptide (TPR) repeat protein
VALVLACRAAAQIERGGTTPDSAVETFLAGSAAFDGGRFDDAIELFTRMIAMELTPAQLSLAHQNRGVAYRSKGDEEKALEDFERAIRFNPSNAGAYVNRGLSHARLGDHDLAIRDYDEALRFDAKIPEAFFNRAISWRALGELDRALRDINDAIRLDPELAPAYVYRGELLAQGEKLDAASRDFETATRIAPDLPEAWYGLASIAHLRGRYRESLQHYAKLLALNLPPAFRAEALNATAWFRATCKSERVRDGKKAVSAATEACELSEWADFSHVDTLAAAFAENREFEKATDFQWFALSLLDLDDERRADAEDRLRLYARGRPFRADTRPPGESANPSVTPAPRVPLRSGKPS